MSRSESESESSDYDSDESPPFKLVSSTMFHRLAELAPAAAHNNPPTDAQLRSITSMQEGTSLASIQTQQNIARIDAQMKALQRQRKILATEAMTQDSVLQLCEKLKAPIRRIPHDVLREIAFHSLPDRPFPSRLQSPLVFAHVCSVWRTIALSTPRLWSTLFLEIENAESLPRYSQVAHEWFKRSRPIPSTFHIYFGLAASACVEDRNVLRAFFSSLTPVIGHICRLSFLSPRMESLRMLFHQPFDWYLPKLYQLNIRSIEPTHLVERSSSMLYSYLDGLKSLSSIPALRNLILDVMIGTREDIHNILPWSQLTRVSISCPTQIRDWFTVMHLCANLKTGIFFVEEDGEAPSVSVRQSSTSPPDHNVENLSLKVHLKYIQFTPVDLLHLFRFPNLTKLDFLSHDSSDNLAIGHPPEAVALPQNDLYLPDLKYLSFNGLTRQQTLRILSAGINIDELAMAVNQFPSKLLESMTYDVGRGISGLASGNILPSLSTLRIDLIANMESDLEGNILRQVLLSRRNEPLPEGWKHLNRVIINAPSQSADFLLRSGFPKWCRNIDVQFEIHSTRLRIPPMAYVTRVTASDIGIWMD